MIDQAKPLVSILIVNFNSADLLKCCLESLKKMDYRNIEVIVVDNASTDGSVEIIRKFFPAVNLIEAKENLGFTGGNNLALSRATGRYIALLNADTEVEPNWLTHLVDFAEAHEDGGVFASKVLFFDNKKIINSVGGYADIFGFSPLRGSFEIDSGQYDKPDTVFYAHGAAMLIRKSLIDRIGFLDETYFIYHEEFDFCWRAWLSGSKVYCVPAAIAYHKLRGRTFYAKGALARRQFLVKKNRIRTVIKNHKSITLMASSIVFNILVSFGELLFYLLQGDFESPKGNWQAFVWNIRELPETLRERLRVQSLYRVNESTVIKNMSKIPYALRILFGLINGKYKLPL